jgi:hypothetical protein
MMDAVVERQPHRAFDAQDLGHADTEDEPAHRVGRQVPGDHHADHGGGHDQHYGRQVVKREDMVRRGHRDRRGQQGEHHHAQDQRRQRGCEAQASGVIVRSHHGPRRTA